MGLRHISAYERFTHKDLRAFWYSVPHPINPRWIPHRFGTLHLSLCLCDGGFKLAPHELDWLSGSDADAIPEGVND